MQASFWPKPRLAPVSSGSLAAGCVLLSLKRNLIIGLSGLLFAPCYLTKRMASDSLDSLWPITWDTNTITSFSSAFCIILGRARARAQVCPLAFVLIGP